MTIRCASDTSPTLMGEKSFGILDTVNVRAEDAQSQAVVDTGSARSRNEGKERKAGNSWLRSLNELR